MYTKDTQVEMYSTNAWMQILVYKQRLLLICPFYNIRHLMNIPAEHSTVSILLLITIIIAIVIIKLLPNNNA